MVDGARQRCIVPFCKRTTKFIPRSEWICGNHWPTVDRRLKRLRTRIKRRLRSLQTPERRAMLQKMDQWTWERCKRQVIERAGGIG